MFSLARIQRLASITNGLRLLSNHITSQSSSMHFSSIIPTAVTQNPWIWQQKDKISLPISIKTQLQLPNQLRWLPPLEEPSSDKAFELPPTEDSNITKEAVRMIVIRRKKMKRHKLKKLRKRMKYEWAKIRQRRELKKEKAFQAILIAQCKSAEAFSAEQYVMDKLQEFNKISRQ